MSGRHWLPALLLLLLAVALHPSWIDDEAARRGMLQIASGLLLVAGVLWLPSRPRAIDALWLALVAWHGIRCFGVEVPADGVRRTAHLLALGVVLVWSQRTTVTDWLMAAVPVTLLVATVGLLQELGIPRELNALLLEAHGNDPDHWSWAGLWLHDLLLHGAPGDAVATLGNRNVASEVTAVAAAACAVLIVQLRRWLLPAAALALGMAYLLVNGSRSGLVALPIAIVLLFAYRGLGVRRRTRVMAAVLLGLGLGLLVHLARPEPEVAPLATPAPTEAPPAEPSTVRVRVQIWRGTLAMAADQPLVGQGAGQFAVRYPLHRSQAEIDLSSWGAYRDASGALEGGAGPRAFRAAPHTAHDDFLEVLAETGAIGLALFLAYWLRLAVGLRREVAGLVPVVAFVLLMLVRSPLGNAPAAVLAFGIAGAATSASDRPRAPRWACLLAAVLGLALLADGSSLLGGQTVAARYVRDLAFPRTGFPRLSTIDRAVTLDPWNATLRSLQLQEAMRTGSPAAITANAAALGALAPHSVGTLLLRAEAAAHRGELAGAIALVERALALDPRDPEAAVQLAALQFQRGALDAVVPTLYRDPHPRLRTELGTVLADFVHLAEQRAEAAKAQGHDDLATAYAAAADDYRTEQRVRDTVAALHDHTGSVEAELSVLLPRLAARDDPRQWVLLAVWSLQNGEPAKARQIGAQLAERGVTLQAWQRHSLDDIDAALFDLPPWPDVLGAR